MATEMKIAIGSAKLSAGDPSHPLSKRRISTANLLEFFDTLFSARVQNIQEEKGGLIFP